MDSNVNNRLRKKEGCLVPDEGEIPLDGPSAETDYVITLLSVSVSTALTLPVSDLNTPVSL